MPECRFNKVVGLLKKETLAQVFSCKFCEISKNTFCYRTPPGCNFTGCLHYFILLLFRLVLSKYNYLICKNEQYKSCNLKLVTHKLSKILNIVKCTECRRNLEFDQKGTDQNFTTQNLRHGKEYCIWKKKKLLKQCLKEVFL